MTQFAAAADLPPTRRLGVLDVGSNTVHLLLVDAHWGARPTPVTSQRWTLLLAEMIGADGILGGKGKTGLRPPPDKLRNSFLRPFHQTGDLSQFFDVFADLKLGGIVEVEIAFEGAVTFGAFGIIQSVGQAHGHRGREVLWHFA